MTTYHLPSSVTALSIALATAVLVFPLPPLPDAAINQPDLMLKADDYGPSGDTIDADDSLDGAGSAFSDVYAADICHDAALARPAQPTSTIPPLVCSRPAIKLHLGPSPLFILVSSVRQIHRR